jgi:hypothetical protein
VAIFCTQANGKIRTVETIQGMGVKGTKENDREVDFKYIL